MKRCVHGVYDPFNDGHYCSICVPIEMSFSIGDMVEVKKVKSSAGPLILFTPVVWDSMRKIHMTWPERQAMETVHPSVVAERFNVGGSYISKDWFEAEKIKGVVYPSWLKEIVMEASCSNA